MNGMEKTGIEWSGIELNGTEWSWYTMYIIYMSIYNIKCNYYCRLWSKMFENYKSKALILKLFLTSEYLCGCLIYKIDPNLCSLKAV